MGATYRKKGRRSLASRWAIPSPSPAPRMRLSASRSCLVAGAKPRRVLPRAGTITSRFESLEKLWRRRDERTSFGPSRRDSNPCFSLERASPWVVISPRSTPGATARCHRDSEGWRLRRDSRTLVKTRTTFAWKAMGLDHAEVPNRLRRPLESMDCRPLHKWAARRSLPSPPRTPMPGHTSRLQQQPSDGQWERRLLPRRRLSGPACLADIDRTLPDTDPIGPTTESPPASELARRRSLARLLLPSPLP